MGDRLQQISYKEVVTTESIKQCIGLSGLTLKVET